MFQECKKRETATVGDCHGSHDLVVPLAVVELAVPELERNTEVVASSDLVVHVETESSSVADPKAVPTSSDCFVPINIESSYVVVPKVVFAVETRKLDDEKCCSLVESSSVAVPKVVFAVETRKLDDEKCCSLVGSSSAVSSSVATQYLDTVFSSEPCLRSYHGEDGRVWLGSMLTSSARKAKLLKMQPVPPPVPANPPPILTSPFHDYGSTSHPIAQDYPIEEDQQVEQGYYAPSSCSGDIRKFRR